ncbi:hypothetical protein D9M68_913030 [compost metagenome]
MGRFILALEVLHQLPQHVGETLHAPYGEPVGLAAELGQGMKSAENVTRAIDEQQMHETDSVAKSWDFRALGDMAKGPVRGFAGRVAPVGV